MSLKQRLSAHIKNDEKSIKLVKKYIRRKLVRPKTTWCAPVLIGVLMLIVPFCVAYTLLYFFASFPSAWCYVICYFVIDMLLLRHTLNKTACTYKIYVSLHGHNADNNGPSLSKVA